MTIKNLGLLFIILSGSYTVYSQAKIVTTGNNLVDGRNPYSADIVIGSDAGIRHDASMMWWSSESALRIAGAKKMFYFSVWLSPSSPNVALGTLRGGRSCFLGNVSIGASDSKGYILAGDGNKGNGD